MGRYPFRIKARSPQVRTQSFIAQPPDLHRFALVMRASRFVARSPYSAVPCIWFLSIGLQFMLHASSPHSVTLMQLRFTSFVMTNLRWDLHPQECAHAGRTTKNPGLILRGFFMERPIYFTDPVPGEFLKTASALKVEKSFCNSDGCALQGSHNCCLLTPVGPP